VSAAEVLERRCRAAAGSDVVEKCGELGVVQRGSVARQQGDEVPVVAAEQVRARRGEAFGEQELGAVGEQPLPRRSAAESLFTA
jgi:hypothetical protein